MTMDLTVLYVVKKHNFILIYSSTNIDLLPLQQTQSHMHGRLDSCNDDGPNCTICCKNTQLYSIYSSTNIDLLSLQHTQSPNQMYFFLNQYIKNAKCMCIPLT